MLAAPELQEMNGQVNMTWRTLRKIAHLLMVHAQVLEYYIHFALTYIADHILPVLPIKDLINEDGEPATQFKLVMGTKPSILYLHILFFLFCCTKLYCTCWDKGVKHASPSERLLLIYPCWNFTASKSSSCLRTTQKQDIIFV